MNSDKPKFYEVLVDVPAYNKDGKPIPFDTLSSGGARNADGSLMAQYRNPRLARMSKWPNVDPYFADRSDRDDDGRHRRQEAAEDLRRQVSAAGKRFLVDAVLMPLIMEVALPTATELIRTEVLPRCQRLAQRKHHLMRERHEVPFQSGDTTNFGTQAASHRVVHEDKSNHSAELSELPQCNDDTFLAEVLQFSEYQNRRAA